MHRIMRSNEKRKNPGPCSLASILGRACKVCVLLASQYRKRPFVVRLKQLTAKLLCVAVNFVHARTAVSFAHTRRTRSEPRTHMSKRSAAASAGSRKAAKTPAGRDRCDRCGKAIFGSQVQEEVNGRCRHADCWPAYKQRRAVFFARLNLCSSYPEFPFTTIAVVQQFNREVDQLIEREALMRALNCVSKMVRFELLRLPNSSWPVLALALSEA